MIAVTSQADSPSRQAARRVALRPRSRRFSALLAPSAHSVDRLGRAIKVAAHVYEITGADNEWQATVTAPGSKKAVVLTEKKVSHTRAYMAAVTHHREAVMA